MLKRAVHTHNSTAHISSFHMEALVVAIKARTWATKGFTLNPGAHPCHISVPESPATSGCPTLLFSAALRPASQLCKSSVDQTKLLFQIQEILLFDENCLGGHELQSCLHAFKRGGLPATAWFSMAILNHPTLSDTLTHSQEPAAERC